MLMHKMKEKGDTGNVFLALNEITLGMQHKNEMESGIEENKNILDLLISLEPVEHFSLLSLLIPLWSYPPRFLN